MTLELRFLQNKWDELVAAAMDEPELLRYRSNLLGSDLRITNFGGGNTSSKIEMTDPVTGEPKQVLWVKGSGGDLGSIERAGFAALDLDRLHALENIYLRPDMGEMCEDQMVALYPQCAFGANSIAASIDTPLHGFLPFPHVDHLHPDWGIALAASANGRERMEEFNVEYGHRLIWLPWQRPGFELAMMMKRAVGAVPGCDGIILGGHGLFTWGETQRNCYANTIAIIDQIGQFIAKYDAKCSKPAFGGQKYAARKDRAEVTPGLMAALRGAVSRKLRWIGNYVDHEDVLAFVNSVQAKDLAHLGTSCPDHFVRTKIRPMFVEWDPNGDITELPALIDTTLKAYREEYAEYYARHVLPDSPKQRDASPTVVLIPGLGMLTFGKNKAEARLTGEFYTNAIHVMQGAGSLSGETPIQGVPQAGPNTSADQFKVYKNYVALPPHEAFRIEYWALEEAKIRRQPQEKELSRHVALVIGAGSGIGFEVAVLAAKLGAAVVVADRDGQAAERAAAMCRKIAGDEMAIFIAVDITKRGSIAAALDKTVRTFGGLDLLINTAAIFPSSSDGVVTDEQWGETLETNVTANYKLVDEAAKVFKAQGIGGSVVLTSSANAVVAKRGSEAYDVSKAALSHLVRELAVSLSPVRVNGISPATVVKGSAMFPRDRVKASLSKYDIDFTDRESDDELRNRLAEFYAERTLTHIPIDPKDCAEAVLFLAGPRTRVTTGHLIPVDGGLVEACLR